MSAGGRRVSWQGLCGRDSVRHCGIPSRGKRVGPRSRTHGSMPKANTPVQLFAREVSDTVPYQLQHDRHGPKFTLPTLHSTPGPHPILRSLAVSGLMCFMSSAFSATPARPRHPSPNAFPARYCDMIGQIHRTTHGGASPSGIAPRNSSIRIQYVQPRHIVT